MEALLISAGVVALAEIGDKTQLLALVLAARFRTPLSVILGILTATLANHFAAGLVGHATGGQHQPGRDALGAGAVLLRRRRMDVHPRPGPARGGQGVAVRGLRHDRHRVLPAEIGDKTQLATVALAARFQALIPVVAGTTLGMLIADVPVVFLGQAAAARLPIRLMNLLAAAVFAALGVLALLGHGALA